MKGLFLHVALLHFGIFFWDTCFYLLLVFFLLIRYQLSVRFRLLIRYIFFSFPFPSKPEHEPTEGAGGRHE